MRYAVIVEEGESGFGAHVPDLSGCVAVAETKQEVLKLILEAIGFIWKDFANLFLLHLQVLSM